MTRRLHDRHPGDVVRVVVGLAVLAIATLAVQRDRLTVFERNLFRLVDDLPRTIEPAVVAVMQLGNVVAAIVLAAVALIAGRRRLASALLAAGPAAWVLAKVVKDVVQRPRPSGFLADVDYVSGGLGFVSGHTAVAAALATAAVPHLPRRVRRVVWCLPWVVGLSRIYVGAHLPLDVVGGAALGWVVGSLIHLAIGAPHGRPTSDDARDALSRIGWSVSDVGPAGVDPVGSFPFVGHGAEGPRFVKLLDPEPRDRDLLVRVARFLLRRDVRDEVVLRDNREQGEHEVAMALLARQAGCRVPAVVGLHHDRGRTWIAQQHVGWRSLDHVEELDDCTLRATWAEVARLHDAGLAHRDLVAANVVVDEQRRPWLVDLAHAQSGAPARAKQNDVAELLASTALVVGACRAIAAATAALGEDVVRAAAAELQPLALSAPTRRALRPRREVLDELRSCAGVHPEPIDPVPTWRRAGTWLVAVGGVVATLAIGGDVTGALSPDRWRWLGLLAVAGMSSALASGVLLATASRHGAAVGRTTAVALRSRTARLVDGAGWRAEAASGLEELGVLRSEARAAAQAARVARIAVGGAIAVAAAALVVADSDWTSPRRWVASAAAIVAASVVTALVARRSTSHPTWDARALVVQLAPAIVDVAAVALVVGAASGATDVGVSVALVALAGAAVQLVDDITDGAPGLAELVLFGILAGGGALVAAAAAALLARVATHWLPLGLVVITGRSRR